MLNLRSANVLNIFCDASITKNATETVGCPGSIVIANTPSTQEVDGAISILRNSTNNNSEITAIELSVLIACRYKDMYSEINIFSDSKISVFGLRSWIFNWVNSTVDNVMSSYSGTPVANQQIFIRIIYLIVTNHLRVNLYHQSGHVNTKNTKSLNDAKTVFLNSNNIFLTDDEIRFISDFNNMIDQRTREYLMSNNTNLVPYLQNPLIYKVPDANIMAIYSSLINRI